MRSFARACLAVTLACAMLNLPVAGAASRPLAVITGADKAHLSNADAQTGSTVYAGDSLATESTGSLRLQVGSGQLYLSPSTAATFSENAAIVHLALAHGTASFASVNAGTLEIETPIATVRPVGNQKAQAQIAITGTNQMTISTFAGSVVVERDGMSRTINAGQAFAVAFDPASAEPQDDHGGGSNSTVSARRDRAPLLFTAIVLGSVIVAGFVIWHFSTESD